MRLLLLLAVAALLTGCASQDCYTEEDIDAAYTWGYQVGRASLLRCPECPEADTEDERGHIKALYR